MKKKLSTRKGFTLAEVLIVVAIMGIVAAFGFIAVHTYKKNMKNLEMQSAAKEIYLASQEHLTLAKSEKLLDDISSERSGFTATATGKYKTAYDLGLKESDDYYVVTSDDKDKANTVLNALLPNGSIEEYIRGNNYAIRYNKKSYQVTDVFYSDSISFGDYLASGTELNIEKWNNLIKKYTSYVKAENGVAGGLIGRIVGNAEISESYAGGHTMGGEYKDSASGQGRYNVYAANGTAGGLIGSVDKYNNAGEVNISTAYTTTSVKGTTAGNFVGSGSVSLVDGTNYATGKVFADGENENVTANLADAAELASAIAEGMYNGTEKARMADPYDSELMKSDGANRMYIYPNMYQLKGDGTA